MKKKIGSLKRFSIGLIAFLVILFLIIWFTSIGLLIPLSVKNWLSQSRIPVLSLWLFSLAMTSIIRILLWLGIKFPMVPDVTETSRDRNWDYLLGFPVWLAVLLGGISGVGLFVYRPICSAPFIVFNVSSNDKIRQIEAGGLFIVPENSSSTITAISGSADILNCSWSFAGKAISSLSSMNSCSTTVNFSNSMGKAILSLSATQGFCSTVAHVPLEIIVQEK